MTAGIAERQSRIDGSLDFQQAIKHRVFRAYAQRVILHPLLAAGTATRRRAGISERRAFLGERGAPAFAVAGTFGARGEPIDLQRHRVHAVFHTAHLLAFPIKTDNKFAIHRAQRAQYSRAFGGMFTICTGCQEICPEAFTMECARNCSSSRSGKSRRFNEPRDS